MDRLAVLRGMVAERRGAGLDAERLEPVALRNSAKPARVARFGHPGQRVEIDMRGKVRLAGIGERIDLAVRAHGLEGRTGALFGVAVVDQQRGTTLADQPPGDFVNDCRRRRAGFEQRALGQAAPRLGHRGVHRPRAGHAGEFLALGHNHPVRASPRRS